VSDRAVSSGLPVPHVVRSLRDRLALQARGCPCHLILRAGFAGTLATGIHALRSLDAVCASASCLRLPATPARWHGQPRAADSARGEYKPRTEVRGCGCVTAPTGHHEIVRCLIPADSLCSPDVRAATSAWIMHQLISWCAKRSPSPPHPRTSVRGFYSVARAALGSRIAGTCRQPPAPATISTRAACPIRSET
jgi:hypothetical protein